MLSRERLDRLIKALLMDGQHLDEPTLLELVTVLLEVKKVMASPPDEAQRRTPGGKLLKRRPFRPRPLPDLRASFKFSAGQYRVLREPGLPRLPRGVNRMTLRKALATSEEIRAAYPEHTKLIDARVEEDQIMAFINYCWAKESVKLSAVGAIGSRLLIDDEIQRVVWAFLGINQKVIMAEKEDMLEQLRLRFEAQEAPHE